MVSPIYNLSPLSWAIKKLFLKLYPTPKAVFNGSLAPVQYFTPKWYDHQDIAVVSFCDCIFA